MKKILVIIVLLFPSLVFAKCDDKELLEWASKVEIKYESNTDVIDPEYLYYLYLSPSRDDIEIRSTNNLYSGVTYGAIQENEKYGIASYVHFYEKTYTFEIFVKEDSEVCAGEQLLKLNYTVPAYNKYSDSGYCYKYPEAELCTKMKDTSDINQEEFIEQMEEYIESKNKKEISNDRPLWKIIIFDYLIWIIIPMVIVLSIYIPKIKKVRRTKNEK